MFKKYIKEQKISEKEKEDLEKELQELEIKQKVLSAHRKRWIDIQFHRIARKVVDILYETGYKTIYIGKM